MLVNLGIGIPTLVANHVPEGVGVFFQRSMSVPCGTSSTAILPFLLRLKRQVPNPFQPLRVMRTFPRARLVMPLLKTHMSSYWHAGP